jgi:hypothetical protein
MVECVREALSVGVFGGWWGYANRRPAFSLLVGHLTPDTFCIIKDVEKSGISIRFERLVPHLLC